MESLQDIYEKARRLHEESSRLDPPTEPHKSKYAAQGMFEDLKAVLSAILDKENDESPQELDDDVELLPSMTLYQLAAVRYHLGVIAVEAEEPSTGEEHLTTALALIKGKEQLAECVWVAVGCFNQLGIIWCEREDHDKAHSFLQDALNLYKKYKGETDVKAPLTPRVVFGGREESDLVSGWAGLEKLHTLTLYYLAQVLGHRGEDELSAKYCLSTLHRQLDSGDYECLSWAVNAATLAQFYHAHNKYKIARHLLSAAWKVILNYRMTEQFIPNLDGDCEQRSTEPRAAIARCWGRYCLALLEESSLNLDNSSTEEENNDSQANEEINNLEKLEFSGLELTSIEEKVPCELVSNFDTARILFLEGLQWMKDAKDYYSLNDHASDYTEIVKDMSCLYKHLAEFEQCPDRRRKMHKRRVDLLETVLKELNPTYYLSVCRQIMYELGEIHSAMVDCKYNQFPQETFSQQDANKVNVIIKDGIKHFQDFLDSFKDTNGKHPDKYLDENVRPVLICYFHQGRLWSKVVDKRDNGQKVSNSLLYYQMLVQYCEQNPEVKPKVQEEYDVCSEMIRLLNAKLRKFYPHLAAQHSLTS